MANRKFVVFIAAALFVLQASQALSGNKPPDDFNMSQIYPIDTDLEFRDKDLKSANWFEAEKYPLIKFQSKRVVKGPAGVEVIGDLTIRDVTKEVTLKMEILRHLEEK